MQGNNRSIAVDFKNHLPLVKDILSVLKNSDFGKLIDTSRLSENSEEIIIDIEPLAIPQYPAFDVHTSERVTITVTKDSMPIVFCRKDFPVVPHLILMEDGSKSLCLFDVPFYDVKYMFNASMFLHRIRNWFEQTAKNELHQKDQPLEPFFPYSENIIVLNPEFERKVVRFFKECPSPLGKLLIEQDDDKICDSTAYIGLFAQSEKTYSQNIINAMPKTLGELDAAFESNLLIQIEEYLHVVLEIKKSAVLYNQLFQQTDNKLRHSKVFVIVYISLARKEGTRESASVKCFLLDVDFQTICKSFGYRYPTKGTLLERSTNTEAYKELSITPYEVHFQLSYDLAQRFSGEYQNSEQKQYLQIGVGALGSQIANNCIRSGFGRWFYVDDDLMLPHNLSRHCLLFSDIGKNKALAIEQYAQKIICTTDKNNYQAINGNLLRDENIKDIQNAIKDSSLVVDTSASVALGRALCHNYAGSTRCSSIFLNPSGDAAVVLLEDSERSITLDILEMQYYKMLLHIPALENHLISSQRVVYSSGCRNSSVILSQDNVAMFSGLATKVIKSTQSDLNSHIYIWTIKQLKPEYYHVTCENYAVISVNSWTAKISESLIETLYAVRAKKLPNETGGILIGSFDYENRICFVVDLISSPEDSIEYPNAYIRGSQGVKKNVERIEKITAGNLTYIGEWHSHPNSCTFQSADDKKLLKSISSYTKVNQCSPGCMIIVGENNYSIYLE